MKLAAHFRWVCTDESTNSVHFALYVQHFPGGSLGRDVASIHKAADDTWLVFVRGDYYQSFKSKDLAFSWVHAQFGLTGVGEENGD